MNSLVNLVKKVIPANWHYYYISRSRRYLSQFGQDFWVFGEVFNQKKGGYFIEIGSADGITFNNTFLLESKYNWTGICIEADPNYYLTLSKMRKAKCLNICLDQANGTTKYIQDGLSSGIISYDTDNNEDVLRNNDKIIELETFTLEYIFQQESVPPVIDYLSIDVEGAEERILSKFPFEKYRFNSITIERPNEKLRAIFLQQGYIQIKEIPGVDVFYIHQSFLGEYNRNIYNFFQKNRNL